MLNLLRAKNLSKKGRHASALALHKTAPAILSNAGLHLSVLEQSKNLNLFQTLALAHSGNSQAAASQVAPYIENRKARPLIGMLAASNPEEILPLIAGKANYNDIYRYCCALTGTNPGQNSAANRQLAPLLEVFLSLKAGRIDQAENHFANAFGKAGIKPPGNDWSNGRIDIETLSGGHGKAIENGPLVSVILAAWNEQDYLENAVNSLLAQDWRAMELLIINDASTDDTANVAETLAAKDNRIRVIHLKENVGLWRAKNIGFKEAKGELITMHDADDWSHPAKLSMQVAPLLKDKNIACTSSYFFRVDKDTGQPFTRNASSIMRWNPSSLMFRAGLTDQIGDFFVDILGSDCEFVGRIEMLNGPSSHMRIRDVPLSIGWQRQHSLSNKFRDGAHEDGITKRLRHWEAWRWMHVDAVKYKTREMFGTGNKIGDFSKILT